MKVLIEKFVLLSLGISIIDVYVIRLFIGLFS